METLPHHIAVVLPPQMIMTAVCSQGPAVADRASTVLSLGNRWTAAVPCQCQKLYVTCNQLNGITAIRCWIVLGCQTSQTRKVMASTTTFMFPPDANASNFDAIVISKCNSGRALIKQHADKISLLREIAAQNPESWWHRPSRSPQQTPRSPRCRLQEASLTGIGFHAWCRDIAARQSHSASCSFVQIELRTSRRLRYRLGVPACRMRI